MSLSIKEKKNLIWVVIINIANCFLQKECYCYFPCSITSLAGNFWLERHLLILWGGLAGGLCLIESECNTDSPSQLSLIVRRQASPKARASHMSNYMCVRACVRIYAALKDGTMRKVKIALDLHHWLTQLELDRPPEPKIISSMNFLCWMYLDPRYYWWRKATGLA